MFEKVYVMSFMHNQFNPNKHSLYKPMNPEKYTGDVNKIVSRSSYEWNFYRWLDTNENITAWITEPLGLPYVDWTGKQRNYFPDVVFKCKTPTGGEKIYMVEIKPAKETVPPIVNRRKKPKTLLQEKQTWETNIRKWEAAKRYCKMKGWEFKLITENELGMGRK